MMGSELAIGKHSFVTRWTVRKTRKAVLAVWRCPCFECEEGLQVVSVCL